VLPAYRDSAEAIEKSLRSIAEQTVASNIVCLVSFEERSPDVQGTIAYLRNAFADSRLKGLHFAIHPKKLAGEIPGAGSNFTWGCYELMRHLGLEHLTDPDSPSFDPNFASLELDRYALTTGDCDCVFHPIYFETIDRMLEGSYCRPDNLFLQSSLFFYLNANTGNSIGNFMNRWFCGNIGATTIEKNHSILIPKQHAVYFAINCVTFTMRTGLQAGFCHPGRVPADMNLYHRVLLARKGQLTCKMVPALVFTEGATGATVKEQANSLVTQWQRWFRGPYQETDYMVGATWNAFTDPLGWLLFWVQFLYFRVWYMWDFQFMLLVLPIPVGWVDDNELRSLFGWLGEWYTAEKSLNWLGYTITITDLFFTLFLTEAIVINIMDKAAKKNGIELSCKFGALQTLAHLLLAVFTLIPAVLLLWVGLFEEFMGASRTFKETPKASMTHDKGQDVTQDRPLTDLTQPPPPEPNDDDDDMHAFYREKTTSRRSSRANSSYRPASHAASSARPSNMSSPLSQKVAQPSSVV